MKKTAKTRRRSGQVIFEGKYYDEKGKLIHYEKKYWDDWQDWRDSFRFFIRKGWKHLFKSQKQYNKNRPKGFKSGFKR